MTDDSAQPPQNPFASPPPSPPAEAHFVERKTVWPQIVGILCIVLGVLGVLGGCWGMFTILVFVDFLA